MDGIKYDGDKVRPDLMPPNALHAVALVQTFGAIKYGEHNWKSVEDGEHRYYAALKRHLSLLDRGEIHDTETGLHHLAHVAINALFLLELHAGQGLFFNRLLDTWGFRDRYFKTLSDIDTALIQQWKRMLAKAEEATEVEEAPKPEEAEAETQEEEDHE